MNRIGSFGWQGGHIYSFELPATTPALGTCSSAQSQRVYYCLRDFELLNDHRPSASTCAVCRRNDGTPLVASQLVHALTCPACYVRVLEDCPDILSRRTIESLVGAWHTDGVPTQEPLGFIYDGWQFEARFCGKIPRAQSGGATRYRKAQKRASTRKRKQPLGYVATNFLFPRCIDARGRMPRQYLTLEATANEDGSSRKVVESLAASYELQRVLSDTLCVCLISAMCACNDTPPDEAFGFLGWLSCAF